jgi:putative membrane-bound dehydrogenase-like protein
MKTISIFSIWLLSVTAYISQQEQLHSSSAATSQFDVHPELNVALFAAEPFLANPTNIDVDHLGRVWVCEVINYRQKIANGDIPERTEGDRIIVVEDSDGDGSADKTHVFYQGRDVDSAHGICVLGNRVIVSANDSVFYLIDDDGDLKADRKELLFTGIGGTQHDHGIHAFVFGPDGKLYFNFGNEGKQICDAGGKPIVDKAGNVVKDSIRPYQQGMIFRCNLDGSEFETLAWNFRNNWEVAIDSFGTLWQSDNDDDGNRSTRINYVMPYGNYGYRDETDGSGWRADRTGMNTEVPLKHWHLNDPGVMPNLLQTGAGSPTGICIYEGDALPDVFQNQMIHCDAGPNIVRSYPVENDGAGYKASTVNMVDGAKKNQWFRPSDVCVAPDGTLIIADWYDPGVGGHRMRDVERGRLFRVTSKGSNKSYSVKEELKEDNAIAWLKSPNQARRFLAYDLIKRSPPTKVIDKLWEVWQSDPNPRFRARAMWMLGEVVKERGKLESIVDAGLADSDPNIRIATLRFCRRYHAKLEFGEMQKKFNLQDPNPQVRREIAVGLREMQPSDLPGQWIELTKNHDGSDRWYLEALGIAAEGHWDECLELLTRAKSEGNISEPAFRDLVWRSRGSQTPELLASIIQQEDVSDVETLRYFRSFDFVKAFATEPVQVAADASLQELGFTNIGSDPKSTVIFRESSRRIKLDSLTKDQRAKIDNMMDNCKDDLFVELAHTFGTEQRDKKLLKLALENSDDQLGADAMATLMKRRKLGQVQYALEQADEVQFEKYVSTLIRCGRKQGGHVLAGYSDRKENPMERRVAAVRALGKTNSGAGDLLWRVQNKKNDPDLDPVIAATLHSVPWGYIRDAASQHFPLPPSKDAKPMPAISDLSTRVGNDKNGKLVFAGAGTCAKCHIVNGKGVEIGPDLSEIGDKLSREAMFESILFPSAGISHNYENWIVAKNDGEIVSGLLLTKTDSNTTIKDINGLVHKINANEIEEQKRLKLSLMPADLVKEFSEQDLIDLVDYLMTLRKAN